jgi:putative endonuclease
MKTYYVYILECSDKSFYVGVTNDIERRLSEHNNNELGYNSYTSKRLPVVLRKSFRFNDINEAIGFEKKIKKWSRSKKEALINEDWDLIKGLSMRKTKPKSTA